jgi:hypothetical protein
METIFLDYLGFGCLFMSHKYERIIYEEIKPKKSIREMINSIPNITPREAYLLEKKMEYIYKEHLYIIQEE